MNPQVRGLSLLSCLLSGMIGRLCLAEDFCPVPVAQWSHREVLQWLDSLGRGFQPYLQAFEENAIDGKDLLELTEKELQEDLGVSKSFHVKKILGLRTQSRAESCASDLGRLQISNSETDWQTFLRPAAGEVLGLLNQSGVETDELSQLIAEEMDAALHDSAQEVVRLEAAELLGLFIVDASANVPPAIPDGAATDTSVATATHAPVLESAKSDMAEILQAKHSTIESFGDMQSHSRDLVIAVNGFVSAAKRPRSGDKRKRERSMLREAFKKWREMLDRTAGRTSATSAALLKRSQERMKAVNVGGGAVRSNIEAVGAAAEALEKAHQKRTAIMNSQDPKVRLALEARSGALEVRLTSRQDHISHLKENIRNLERMRQSKDRVIEQVEAFVLDTNRKRMERSGAVRTVYSYWWWWADTRYVEDWSVTNHQADRSIDAQNQERAQAERAKEVLGRQIRELEQEANRASSELADMQGALQTWKETLASTGLFAAESEVQHANERLELAQNILMEAMKAAGTGDPEAAARVITLQHKAQILMSSAAAKAEQAAAQARSFTAKFDNMIARLEDDDVEADDALAHQLHILSKAVTLVGDVHTQRMRLLDNGKTKHRMIQGYLDGELNKDQPAEAQQLMLGQA